MSLKAMAWAIEQECGSPSAKVTLWSIANHANVETWCAFPSQESISTETEQSRDSIQRRIPDLMKRGLVKRLPLRYAGRRSIDLYILPPSPYWTAHLDEIEKILPRGFVFDPKAVEEWAAADCGSDKKGTAAAPLPQALPQSAPDAAALVRQHEPVINLLNQGERETREREEGSKPTGVRFLPPAEDDPARAAFDAIAESWSKFAKGGRGAIGNSEKGVAAIADLGAEDRDKAVERAPRYLRALRDAKRAYTPSIETYVRNREFDHHPPPVTAEGKPIEGQVLVVPYSRTAWALFAQRYAAGKSVRDTISWIRNGADIQAAAAPTEAEMAELVAVAIGSPEHVAWREHCKRLGFDLPMPDRTEWIFLPSKSPKSLSLEWRGYHLIEAVRVEIRSPAWWWRVYRPKAPIVDMLADRSVGTRDLEMGPIPLPAEIDEMVKIEPGTPEFDDWDLWFHRQGVRHGIFALQGPIWAPTKRPPALHEPIDAAPDYEEIGEALQSAGGEQ